MYIKNNINISILKQKQNKSCVESYCKAVGLCLFKARQKKKMAICQLAEISNLSISIIEEYELGIHNTCDLIIINKIANALDLDLDQILCCCPNQSIVKLIMWMEKTKINKTNKPD